ncbi:hypothetical protein PsorP6_004378 [Peronosclerospora sorghi]|uniref:Uncharacterized protein n=1 Tax=Peronosclerospora sorghi TaxID=230839 RepID=A0ACC0VQ47_9STRA|nr:hypothetical protein PsorP6_004378 [Peronosclerospora sorghi]
MFLAIAFLCRDDYNTAFRVLQCIVQRPSWFEHLADGVRYGARPDCEIAKGGAGGGQLGEEDEDDRKPPVPVDVPWMQFKKEVTESLAYVIDEVTTIDFENLVTTSRVRHHNQDGSAGNGSVVTYQAPEQVVSCDYNEFSFSGILFRHALRVLLRHKVTAITEQYILKRWRWDTLLLDNEGSAEVGPAVSAKVSVAVRAQVSDKVAKVAGVVSEVAQVAATAASITVAEADATPAPAAANPDSTPCPMYASRSTSCAEPISGANKGPAKECVPHSLWRRGLHGRPPDKETAMRTLPGIWT